jgi:PD-(D/E)XK nuclease superfamily protein
MTSPTPETEERKHHEYSPSTLQSLEACPCYRSRPSTHIRTIIGTISHKVTETREDDNRLDDEDANAAAECLDFYDKRLQLAQAIRHKAVQEKAVTMYDGGGFSERDPMPEAEKVIPAIIELLETYLAVDKIKFSDGVESTTAGYVDRVIIAHTRTYAELFDWKFGMWPVEKAENNLQGMAYVLGLFREYPTLESARFWFKQPNTGEISHVLITRTMVVDIYLRIQAVVARARVARGLVAQNDWSMANPMVPVCNFCDHIGRCQKVLAIALKVGKKFYPLEIPEHITPTMVQDPHNTSMAMRLSAVMAVWAKSYRSATTDRVIRRDADTPNGFVLTSRADRVVKDVDALRKIALKYLSKKEYDALLSKEPPFGTLEDAIKDKAPRGQKTAVLEKFQAEIMECGAVTKGDPYTFLRAVADKKD